MAGFEIRPLAPADRGWVAQFVAERWGAETVVVHGETYRPQQLPGFLALDQGATAGLVTYHVAGESCEIVTLDSLRPNLGIGAALIEAVEAMSAMPLGMDHPQGAKIFNGKTHQTFGHQYITRVESGKLLLAHTTSIEDTLYEDEVDYTTRSF